MLIPFVKLFKTYIIEIDFPSAKDNQVLTADHYFSEKMATLRIERKLAALNEENCEENPRRNLAQNSNFPRSQEDYITQVSEEIEG